MEITKDLKVGDLVKINFKIAQVFDKNNIDYCCGGGMTIEEACKMNGTDFEKILPELKQVSGQQDADSEYINSLNASELCDYIEKRHHSYVNRNLNFIKEKLKKLCDVHGMNHYELFEIKEEFDEAAGNLTVHMKKEELILFPYIRKMVQFEKEEKIRHDEFGGITQSINLMNAEHDTEGERFKKISSLSNRYQCPPDGCNTYNITFKTLQEFENDLHKHIHLENNILFPMALKLENKLIQLSN